MSTVLRSVVVMAALTAFAPPIIAQHGPPVPNPTVVIPPIPSPRAGQDFGQAMRVWGESLRQSLGGMGDSLGKWGDSLGTLGSELGTAETEEATHPSEKNRARVEAIQHAMDDIQHKMAGGHDHGHNWRDFARQSRRMAAQARANAMQANAPVAGLITRVQQDPEAVPVPPADSFSTGPLTIAAGTTHTGSAATANGDLQVFGTVTGNAVALNGNVEIHPGAEVTGNAFAAGGEVRVDSGGMVDGEVRSLVGDFGPVPTTAVSHVIGGGAATNSRWHDVRMALMAYALVLMLSIGVLTFADEQLGHATTTLADRFGRSAWFGLVGAVLVGPGLGAVCLALTITVVGLLVVPFAVVGYVAIAIGAALLGFIAIAEATGTAILHSGSQASLTPRGAQLRAIVTGVSIYCGLWVLTAALGTDAGIGIAVRSVAVVVTVVAATIGFGSVVLWRFDARRASRAAAKAKTPIDEAVWQTPTPVAGVAAASRTPPAASSSERPS